MSPVTLPENIRATLPGDAHRPDPAKIVPWMMLVGLTGAKGVGKTTVADVLYRIYRFKSIAFADPLRVSCTQIFGLTKLDYEDRYRKEQPLDRWPYQSPRQILQFVGTELFRKNYPGVWIEALNRRIDEHVAKVDLLDRAIGKDPCYCGIPYRYRIVVPDVRFPDEEKAIRDRGGIIIRVTRPGYGDEATKTDTHSSEQGWRDIPFDFELKNNGQRDNIAAWVGNIMTPLLFPPDLNTDDGLCPK